MHILMLIFPQCSEKFFTIKPICEMHIHVLFISQSAVSDNGATNYAQVVEKC